MAKKSASTQTKKFNGKKYKKESCHTKKKDAKAKAKSIRDSGGTARVVKIDGRNCVFKGPKSKRKGRKK